MRADVSDPLTLCFLGQREYLQGTTLFDALRPWYAGGSAIEFKLARMMRSDRVQVEVLDADAQIGEYAAHLRWSDGQGARRRIGVLPLEPSASPRREAFDEAALVAPAVRTDRQIELSGQHGETLLRCVVALNKVLLNAVLQPPAPGQWLFTRLLLRSAPERFEHLRLRFRNNLALAAVTSDIEVDGNPLGEVMFSWIKR